MNIYSLIRIQGATRSCPCIEILSSHVTKNSFGQQSIATTAVLEPNYLKFLVAVIVMSTLIYIHLCLT